MITRTKIRDAIKNGTIQFITDDDMVDEIYEVLQEFRTTSEFTEEYEYYDAVLSYERSLLPYDTFCK